MTMDPLTKAHALRVLVAPDSFKGSLEAHEVAQHIATGILKAFPDSLITQAPIADGGEGTAQALAVRLGGTWRTTLVTDANHELTELPFAVCNSSSLGEFAIFDVAEIVGLPDAKVAPEKRTTIGVGKAIQAIAALGFKTIVVGLGGSSTNEGGAGMLSELGIEFVDFDGISFYPVLETLHKIRKARKRGDTGWLASIKLIGLTDVTSVLNGPKGATHVFGRQKGVQDLAAVDRIVANYAAQVSSAINADYSEVAGAGAAGGLGFAIRVLGGSLQPGADFVLDALELNDSEAKFDWIVTGEGKSDGQTLLGKGPAVVARFARSQGIPVTLLSGAVEQNADLFQAFDGCFSIQSAPVTLQYAMENTGPLLEVAACNLARFFATR